MGQTKYSGGVVYSFVVIESVKGMEGKVGKGKGLAKVEERGKEAYGRW